MFRSGERTFTSGECMFRSGERTFATAKHNLKGCCYEQRMPVLTDKECLLLET